MGEQARPEHFSVYATAMRAQQAGINVLPIRADGSKRPDIARWRVYQQRRVTPGEVVRWFRSTDRGLAVMTGPISGNLEALDIDSLDTYRAWLDALRADAILRPLYERIARGYIEATPAGGRHLLYRSPGVERNRVLARRAKVGAPGYQTLIETRGAGGLLIIAPSAGQVHPSGRPYTLLHGDIADIATITAAERSQLLQLARTFDEGALPPREQRAPSEVARSAGTVLGGRPGDIFNQRATWEELLLPHGWQLVQTIDGESHWRRPGKTGPGISATTNYAASDLFYVFSTSTIFAPERGYTKFATYTLLEHGGDFAAAARTLAAEGYVDPTRE
jgi:putative DNA primase/helicase